MRSSVPGWCVRRSTLVVFPALFRLLFVKRLGIMTNLQRIRKELSPARRKEVETRAAQLIAEAMGGNLSLVPQSRCEESPRHRPDQH